MLAALEEAKRAAAEGEVPVGAVIVENGKIIGRGHNRTEALGDPTAHAEMIAIRDAARHKGGWRLTGCDLYVTTEPCSMCAGAMTLARIRTAYIGTMDPKAGACGSVLNIPACPQLNHETRLQTGIMEDECAEVMRGFFRRLREKKRSRKEGLSE